LLIDESFRHAVGMHIHTHMIYTERNASAAAALP